MGKEVVLGDVIYIPSEKANYTVSDINGSTVILTNYKTKAVITLDYEAALEIKSLIEIDMSGHNEECPV